MENIVPVILSGGNGLRLFPISSKECPKQFNLNIGNPPLIEKTLSLLRFCSFLPPVIITNIEHRNFVGTNILEQCSTVIFEPESRNTASAILSASLYVQKKYDDNTIILVLPSDHIINCNDKFLKSIQSGIKLLQNSHNENIITFGVKPLYAETGYGYIETENNHNIKSFSEKPSKKTAKEFILKENLYWNCGIFLMKTKTYSELYKKLLPQSYSFVNESLEKEKCKMIFLNENYKKATNISIDYAILEKIKNIKMVEMLSPWHDVGNYRSLHQIKEKDKDGNYISSNIQAIENKNCFIQNTCTTTLAVYGMKNTIIVQTKNATLVAPIEKSQEIKTFIEKIEQYPLKIQRHWGHYEILEKGKTKENFFKIKKLSILPHKSLSMQSHAHRSEHWTVIRSTATAIKEDQIFTLKIGESISIPKQIKHKLINNTNEIVEIIEVQTGSYLEEDDITRYDIADGYGDNV